MEEQIDFDNLSDGWCQTVELPVASNWELVQQVSAHGSGFGASTWQASRNRGSWQ